MKNDHKRWLYNGGVETGRIFDEGEEIPDGWFDRPNETEWDNPPAGYVSKSTKYPSQMNKDELVDLGAELGLELEGMTKKEMLEAINGEIKKESDIGDEPEDRS